MKTDEKPGAIMKSDGSVFQNFAVSLQGAIRPMEAFCNGILIQYVFDHDYDGNQVLRPVISTICKDGAYADLLTKAAKNLFTKVEVIPLLIVGEDDGA